MCKSLNVPVRIEDGRLIPLVAEGHPEPTCCVHGRTLLSTGHCEECEAWLKTPIIITDPLKGRPCIALRYTGGMWTIREDGEGERLSITNHVRELELNDLNDDDLQSIHSLVGKMIGIRNHCLPAK